MLATLGIGIFAIRNGLKPMREISRKASLIGPNTSSVPLAEQNLPTKQMGLVGITFDLADHLFQLT